MKFIFGLVLAIFDPFQIPAYQGFTGRSDPLLKANLPTLIIYMDYNSICTMCHQHQLILIFGRLK